MDVSFAKQVETGLWVGLISAQTSQEGIKYTKAKKQLRAYCPNMYTVPKTSQRLIPVINKFIHIFPLKICWAASSCDVYAIYQVSGLFTKYGFSVPNKGLKITVY